MIKASSLFYALIITLLISMVSVSIISLSYYNNVELETYSVIPELIENCHSAEAILLSEWNNLPNEKEKLLYEIEDSTFISHVNWGVWEVGSVVSKRRKDTVSHSFLFGSGLSYPNDVLYVKEGISGLSVSGNSRIKGNVHVPGGRVKPAFISGQSFIGDKLVEGNVSETPRAFPRVNTPSGSNIELSITSVRNKIEFHAAPDDLSRGFEKETVKIFSADSVFVHHKIWEGNILLESSKALFIGASCKFKNLLCKAPRIYIQSGFKGTIQCIATDLIELYPEVELSYPSSLVLLESEFDKREVILSENSTLEGVIWLLKSKNESLVSLNRNCTVKGQVISEDALELKGRLKGQAIANALYLKTGSGFYKNHLLNVDLEMSLPDWFVGASLNNSHNNTLKICNL